MKGSADIGYREPWTSGGSAVVSVYESLFVGTAMQGFPAGGAHGLEHRLATWSDAGCGTRRAVSATALQTDLTERGARR